MLNNIRKFDGWMIVDSYENITIGKGVITLHVNSLKTMMEYMPIVEELDRRVNLINTFNKIVIMNSSSGRFDKPNDYEERLKELEYMVDDFYKTIESHNLVTVSWSLNAYSDNYFEEIILIKE